MFTSQTFIKRSVNLEGKLPFRVFEPSLGDLEATYADHIRLVGKRVWDFLLVIIKLFFARSYGCGATSDYRFKIGDFALTRAG